MLSDPTNTWSSQSPPKIQHQLPAYGLGIYLSYSKSENKNTWRSPDMLNIPTCTCNTIRLKSNLFANRLTDYNQLNIII